MPPSRGIDTSVLVRLLTGEPVDAYERCERELAALRDQGVVVFASNQVIGEAYVTVQHHYNLSEPGARAALLYVLNGELVTPLNGPAVIEMLETPGGAGLFDRLIADDYRRWGLEVLTLDRRMARLPGVSLM